VRRTLAALWVWGSAHVVRWQCSVPATACFEGPDAHEMCRVDVSNDVGVPGMHYNADSVALEDIHSPGVPSWQVLVRLGRWCIWLAHAESAASRGMPRRAPLPKHTPSTQLWDRQGLALEPTVHAAQSKYTTPSTAIPQAYTIISFMTFVRRRCRWAARSGRVPMPSGHGRGAGAARCRADPTPQLLAATRVAQPASGTAARTAAPMPRHARAAGLPRWGGAGAARARALLGALTGRPTGWRPRPAASASWWW
jgi:hypothetical protein